LGVGVGVRVRVRGRVRVRVRVRVRGRVRGCMSRRASRRREVSGLTMKTAPLSATLALPG